jgi:hypothetical protein
MAGIQIDNRPGYRITLDVSQPEADDLMQAVYEAASYVDNWRSDPRVLFDLCKQLADQMGLTWTAPPPHEPWHDVINRAAAAGSPPWSA